VIALDDVRDQLDALAQHVRAKHGSPALVWGVMLDGQLALDGSAGSLEDGRAPTTRTVFRIASMTKSFTAATVLALRDGGALPGLDEPIPGIVAPTSDAPPITPRLVLSMSAGFAGDDPWADRHLDIDPDDLDRLLASGITFAVDPGTRFEYSNLGYGALGRAIERWTGERLQTLAERQLLRPLDLARTTWTRPDDDDWARPYRIEDGVAHLEGDPLADGALAPMGGLWSCIDDLVVWMAWLDDAFPGRDGLDDGPLRRSSRRELQQVHRAARVTRSAPTGEGLDHVPERIDGGGYGFGHQVLHDDRFGTVVGHSGGLPGYGSNMRWLPGRRIGAVALANSTYAPMRLLTRRMLELLDDHGLVPSADAPAPRQLLKVAAHLVALLNDWSDRAADVLFTDNVALDESYERRAATAAALTSSHGSLTVEDVVARSAAAATITFRAADGHGGTIEFTLSPQVPLRVQEYQLH
jgi:CubicO group peptidase (beta-lactamase class C family)